MDEMNLYSIKQLALHKEIYWKKYLKKKEILIRFLVHASVMTLPLLCEIDREAH